MNTKLHEILIESTKEIFSQLFHMDLSWELSHEKQLRNRGDITGLIGISGSLSGLIAIHCTKGMAVKIASQMIGIEIKKINHEVQDAIGELINVIAGNFKTKLNFGEGPLVLSTPTIMVGDSFTIDTLTRETNALLPFSCERENFWIEVSFNEKFMGAYVYEPRPN